MKLKDMAACAFARTINNYTPEGAEATAKYFKLPIDLRNRIQAYLPREIQRLYLPIIITTVNIAEYMCYVHIIADDAYNTILVYEDNQLWMKLNTYNGFPHGKFTIYYDDGEPWHVYLYRFGKMISHKFYYRNGRLAFHRTYREDGIELREIVLYSKEGEIITYYYTRYTNQEITTIKLIDDYLPVREEFTSIARTCCSYVELLTDLLYR